MKISMLNILLISLLSSSFALGQDPDKPSDGKPPLTPEQMAQREQEDAFWSSADSQSLSAQSGCSTSTPEINLESPGGSLHGLPRDHQDGIGTCYANVARNMIAAASGGRLQPSFMDLALSYKSLYQNNSISTSVLDSGMTCDAIQAASERGLCPQSSAPLENGELNSIANEILGTGERESDSRVYSRVFDELRSFFRGQTRLEANGSMTEIMQQAGPAIRYLQNHPNVILPMPIVRHRIPADATLSGISKNYTQGADEFNRIYNEAYSNFEPHYMNAVIQGKNRNQIFELYSNHMRATLTQLNILDDLNFIRDSYFEESAPDFSNPELSSQINETINFWNSIGSQNSLHEANRACIAEQAEAFDFFKGLSDLSGILSAIGVDPSQALDQSGNLLSREDLIQVLIAPNCVSAQNRQQLDVNIICREDPRFITDLKNSSTSRQNQLASFRQRLRSNLEAGLPMGNVHQAGQGAHINTIVGLRFNPENSQCEVLIRESMTGTSFWQNESELFDNITHLTEYRVRN